MPKGEKQTCVPIHLNMNVQLELNETKFIIRAVNGNNNTSFLNFTISCYISCNI